MAHGIAAHDKRFLHSINVSQIIPKLKAAPLQLGGQNSQGENITLTDYYLLRNGKPHIPIMGEFHFSRYAQAGWEEELCKMKAGGVQIVATYVFWIHIEGDEGHFDWTGGNDLRQFVALCGKHHLEAIIRIGPFAHGECRNGGLPDWLYGRPFAVRSNDERYLAYVRRLYAEIADQLAGLLFKAGGPVIGIQLENEYMHASAPWEVTLKQGVAWVPRGADGVAHLRALKEMAISVGLDVPLYTCTGWLGSPVIEGELLPMQGGYVFTPWSPDPHYRQPPTREFLFRDRHRYPLLTGTATYDPLRYPFACCEIGGGIQDTYYHRNIVPPEAVEALVVMNLAGGANLIGYYMFHGGSNPISKHGYLNEFTVPRISYDFQAPLGEFGQINDSYRFLRILHMFLNDFGERLAPMRVALPENALMIEAEDTHSLRFAARAADGAGFLFLNNYQDHVEMTDLTEIRLAIQTADGLISLPHAQSLTLGKNVSAILPFGLSLDGVHLHYATVQPLARLAHDDAITYFFFAPHKMHSEYAFQSDTFRALSVPEARITEEGDGGTVIVSHSAGYPIELTNDEGKMIRIFTLTRQQAERAAKVRLWGEERLVISDGTLILDGNDPYLLSLGDAPIGLSIFPPPDDPIHAGGRTLDAASTPDRGFAHYTILPLDQRVAPEVERIGADRARVKFTPDFLAGVNNVYLRIEYVGDMGNAFIDGKLIADHFYSGRIWEIGLKHFAERLRDNELFILIDPIRPASELVRYVPSGMAFQQASEKAEIAVIESITTIVEHRIALS